MNKIQVLTILLVALSLTGCVTPVALEKQAPTAEYVPSGTVAIAVLDQRERVLKGGKPPTFIGKAHGAFGIPADWHVKPVLSTEEGDKERTPRRVYSTSLNDWTGPQWLECSIY